MQIRKTNSVANRSVPEKDTETECPFPILDQQMEIPNHMSPLPFFLPSFPFPSFPFPSLLLFSLPHLCLLKMKILLLVVQAKAVQHLALAPYSCYQRADTCLYLQQPEEFFSESVCLWGQRMASWGCGSVLSPIL